jgi:ribosomal protein S18 acetylase RimI-like enzyme
LASEQFEPIFASLVSSKCFFVAELGGVLKGFYRVARHEGRANHAAYLGTLAVTPEEKGSGFAFRMVTEAIECLKEQGVLRVELMLEADNPRALAFYKKLGFVQEGTMRAAYKRAGQRHFIDELFLARLLEPLPRSGDA